MNLKNGVMLITYADSLGKDLSELHQVLERYFKGAVAGVHILPFFPSTSDRGFSPTRYDAVDPRFGTWKDLEKLACSYSLMYDFMINHLSSRSDQYLDFQAKKDNSKYAGMFIRYQDFWPGGEPSESDIEKIYKRKPRAPYVTLTFKDGTTEKIWCTFGDDQIDLDIRNEVTWRFIEDNLKTLVQRGAALIRLDAFAYVVKKVGGSCFFEEPEIWDVMGRVDRIMAPLRVEILPEIHEHYTIQLKLAEKGYWVYDFALPMLLLYSLFTGETAELAHWLRICPRKQFTTLDTHDGIGVVDVRGLLTDEQIEKTKNFIFEKSPVTKDIMTTAAYKNMDVYQINCTYYSALGEDDDAYIVARAVQIFAPGIPQVYYIGLLAGKNDTSLLEATKSGRDINRHVYTVAEVETEIQRPVVQRLFKLLKFRNDFPAFDGDCETASSGSILTVRRVNNGYTAELTADMKNHACRLTYSLPGGEQQRLDI
jgi:sucrose phosphorylase